MADEYSTHSNHHRVVACHQPLYLPWAGLLHKAALADCFVVLDTVAFSRGNWQSRNRIKGPNGAFWLTVPLVHDSLRYGRLDAVEIAAESGKHCWQAQHWKALQHAYGRAPYWSRYAPRFAEIYQEQRWQLLVDLNMALLKTLFDAFHLQVDLIMASDLHPVGRKSDLILALCVETGATAYVCGSLSRDYLVEQDFTDHGIQVVDQNYRANQYPQQFGDFVSNLSAVDILFNCGPDSQNVLLARNLTKPTLRSALDQSRSQPFPGRPGNLDERAGENT